MKVYYYQGYPIAAPLTFQSNEPAFTSDSVSLKHQRVSQGAQRWELEFGIQYSGLENYLFTAITSTFNTVGTMTMPQLIAVDNTATTTVNLSVASNYSAGVSFITATTVNDGEFLPRGSFIQFSNHPKIYMVKSGLFAHTTPTGISIYPNLQVPITTSETILVPGSSSPPQYNYYEDRQNLQGLTYTDGLIFSIDKVRLIEAL